MQGAVAIDYIYGGICGVPGIREMLFNAEAQRTQRDLDTIQFRRDILTPADDRPPAVERA